MKKFFYFVLSFLFLMALTGCDNVSIKEYTGTSLTKLTFETIDYNGGYTTTYIFDFKDNTVKKNGYLPSEEEERVFETISEFTDEEEKVLIDKLYSYGLFDIKEEYASPSGIIDGGGWSLNIDYSDGTNKESNGSNNAPNNVFSNCAKAFYDICQDGVVASVPTEYYYPPNVSYSISYSIVEGSSSHYSFYVAKADYKWNGFESKNNDIYLINQSYDFDFKFTSDINYKLVLYTANYGDYEKFNKSTVVSYDSNQKLTNEKIIFNDGWFQQVELDLELNKIYLIKFEFADGDFVEYTFNTVASADE